MLTVPENVDTKRILITGACGFLGRFLVHKLVQNGHHVTGIDRNPLKDSGLESPSDFMQFDLIDSPAVDYRNFEVIFHLAGIASTTHSIQSPDQDFEHNLNVTFRLLDQLRRCSWKGKFIYISTAAVYGESRQAVIKEETATRPITPYGVSNLAAEEYTRVFSQCYGFPVAIARIFSLYGPGQKKQVVFDILRKTLLSDEPITLLGDGSEVRDFIYVKDAVQALALLINHAKTDAPIFNLCSSEGISISALAKQIIALANQDPQRLVFTGKTRSGDPQKFVGCNKKLYNIGFSLDYTLQEGLKDTLTWFQKNVFL